VELILVDTSVWIDHLRRPIPELTGLIAEERCLLHPYVLAEIALGNLANWSQRVIRFRALPSVEPLGAAELVDLIDRLKLQGSGLGFVDAHLLGTAATRPNVLIWSRDQKLVARAKALEIGANLT
jgi:predicted nucleic acid-binding protein